MNFPIALPVEPMCAQLTGELPSTGDYLFEPKWDGFRAIVFRSDDDVYIQSRDAKPLDRYFPELHTSLRERLPERCAVDSEVVIASDRGLDFDALQLRLHPAATRIAKLAKESPAAFVAFDLLAAAGRNVMSMTQVEGRAQLKTCSRLRSPRCTSRL